MKDKRFRRFGLELELGVAEWRNSDFDDLLETAIDSSRFVNEDDEYCHNDGDKWLLGGDGSVSNCDSTCTCDDDCEFDHECDGCDYCEYSSPIGEPVVGRELTTPIMTWEKSPRDLARLEKVAGIYDDYIRREFATTENAGMHCHISTRWHGDGKAVPHTSKFSKCLSLAFDTIGEPKYMRGDYVVDTEQSVFEKILVDEVNALAKKEDVKGKFGDRYDGTWTRALRYGNCESHSVWFNISRCAFGVTKTPRKNCGYGSFRIYSDHCEMRIGGTTGNYQKMVDYIKWTQNFAKTAWKNAEKRFSGLCKDFGDRFDKLTEDSKGLVIGELGRFIRHNFRQWSEDGLTTFIKWLGGK